MQEIISTPRQHSTAPPRAKPRLHRMLKGKTATTLAAERSRANPRLHWPPRAKPRLHRTLKGKTATTLAADGRATTAPNIKGQNRDYTGRRRQSHDCTEH